MDEGVPGDGSALPKDGSQRWQGRRGQRSEFERPVSNIVVLVLACWMMRIPVVYMDLIRYVP